MPQAIESVLRETDLTRQVEYVIEPVRVDAYRGIRDHCDLVTIAPAYPHAVDLGIVRCPASMARVGHYRPCRCRLDAEQCVIERLPIGSLRSSGQCSSGNF